MDPLTGIAVGLGALNSLSSLLGGARAAKRAARARELAIRDYMRQSGLMLGEGGEYGRMAVQRLAGELSDALGVTGRALGSALAGAGVWNSSSVAGALTEQSERGAAALKSLMSEVARDQLSARRSVLSEVAGMQVRGASEDYANAMAQRAEGLHGLGALAQMLGQLEVTNRKPRADAVVGGNPASGDFMPRKGNAALSNLLQFEPLSLSALSSYRPLSLFIPRAGGY